MDDAELEAAIGAGSPARVAEEWFQAMLEGDVDRAWPLGDPDFRLATVQIWTYRLGDAAQDAMIDEWDEVTAALAEERPSHPRWRECATWIAQTSGTAWEEFRLYGFSRLLPVEILSPELAIVRLALGEQSRDFDQAVEKFIVQSLTMRFSDGVWRVAGERGALLEPD